MVSMKEVYLWLAGFVVIVFLLLAIVFVIGKDLQEEIMDNVVADTSEILGVPEGDIVFQEKDNRYQKVVAGESVYMVEYDRNGNVVSILKELD